MLFIEPTEEVGKIIGQFVNHAWFIGIKKTESALAREYQEKKRLRFMDIDK